jgi:DNA-binding NarL/FixJ family response regulator
MVDFFHAQSASRIGVAVLEDHPEYREILSGVIANQADLTLVGAWADVAAMAESLGSIRPDVFIVDLQMEGFLGDATAAGAVRATFSSASVLLLPLFHRRASFFDALKADPGGGAGDRIRRAVREIAGRPAIRCVELSPLGGVAMRPFVPVAPEPAFF